jgi:DNA-binding beta-propeller fold protein YncE
VARVRAPELTASGGWIGTGGAELRLADLRGKVVVLDFWTSCCANCWHVLDELRAIERAFPDEVVVVGVHSPKFPHEREHATVVAAVERLGVDHPVVDDPDLHLWHEYAAKAWPTLVVIDPEGYVVAHAAGEGHGPALEARIREIVDDAERRGVLRRGPSPVVREEPAATELRYPSGLAVLGDHLVVCDTGHRRLALVDPDSGRVTRSIPGGWLEPQGAAPLPPEVATVIGWDLLVADTAGHRIWGVDLATGAVKPLAGTGRQLAGRVPVGTAPAAAAAHDLSSPWDVVWWPAAGVALVAMAGVHQLWGFDPVRGTIAPLAGTGGEGLHDGPVADAWLAQPSGLAVDERGTRVWVADSETSALRRMVGGVVTTVVGTGLFEFGHVDGPVTDARLQHPLAVAVLPDGAVAVADTYNGAVRRYDAAAATLTTMVAGLSEPSGLALVGDTLWVSECGAHRLTGVPARARGRSVAGTPGRIERPAAVVAAGEVVLEVEFAPAPGQHLDDRDGPPTMLEVDASPADLLVEGSGRGGALTRRLVLAGEGRAGVLHVTARAATCDDGGVHPACHLATQEWGIPVRVVAGGARRLTLMLHGTP